MMLFLYGLTKWLRRLDWICLAFAWASYMSGAEDEPIYLLAAAIACALLSIVTGWIYMRMRRKMFEGLEE